MKIKNFSIHFDFIYKKKKIWQWEEEDYRQENNPCVCVCVIEQFKYHIDDGDCV